MDRLLDLRLCHECCEEKDDAYTAGFGFAWAPDCGLIECRDFNHLLCAGLVGYEDDLVKPDY